MTVGLRLFAGRPGNCAAVWTGWVFSLVGKLIGSLPDGLTSPNSTSATAEPCSCPPYQASMTEDTLLNHGVNTGPPVARTTTVCALTLATASISRSWSCCNANTLSYSSDRKSRATTPATFDVFASATACCSAGDNTFLGGVQPKRMIAPRPDNAGPFVAASFW